MGWGLLSTLLEIPGVRGCSLSALAEETLAEPRILTPGSEMAVERPGVVFTALSAHQRWGEGHSKHWSTRRFNWQQVEDSLLSEAEPQSAVNSVP